MFCWWIMLPFVLLKNCLTICVAEGVSYHLCCWMIVLPYMFLKNCVLPFLLLKDCFTICVAEGLSYHLCCLRIVLPFVLQNHTNAIQSLDWSAETVDSAFLIKSCTVAPPEQCVCKLNSRWSKYGTGFRHCVGKNLRPVFRSILDMIFFLLIKNCNLIILRQVYESQTIFAPSIYHFNRSVWYVFFEVRNLYIVYE